MIKAKRLIKYNKKFKRYSGWSGADGIFSFVYNEKVLMYFSDTFIGNSNDKGKRISFQLINNKDPISSIFNTTKGYYWLEDGIIEKDNLYIFALHMQNDIFSRVPFEIKSVDLIKLSLPFDNCINYQLVSTLPNFSNIVLGSSIIKENGFYYIFGYINEFNNKKLILSKTKSLENINLYFLNKNGKFSKNIDNLMILKEHLYDLLQWL